MIEFDYQTQTVVVYDSILFDIGHNVRRWADAVERRYTENAIAFAPVNRRMNKSSWYAEYPVGSLKASISGSVTRVGPKHLQTDITVAVPYAIYVIEGTDWIVPTHSKYLNLPVNPGFGEGRARKIVRGQVANDFMLLAHEATAARHPSLRGGGVPFAQF